jgi:hypothetical protein
MGMECVWHGMCELMWQRMAGDWHGNGMGAAWHMGINVAGNGRGLAWEWHGCGMVCVN